MHKNDQDIKLVYVMFGELMGLGCDVDYIRILMSKWYKSFWAVLIGSRCKVDASDVWMN